MSDAISLDDAVPPSGYLHHCFVFRDHAACGFTIRRGTLWTALGAGRMASTSCRR